MGSAAGENDCWGDAVWHRAPRGTLAVVLAALIYFGAGALVSKSWHIVIVLILRYYLRGLLGSVVSLHFGARLMQCLGILGGPLHDATSSDDKTETDSAP